MANKVKSYWDERWIRIEAKAPTKTKDYYFSDYGRLKSLDKSTENTLLTMMQGLLQRIRL